MANTSLPPNAIVIAAAYEPAAIFIRQLRAIWPDAYVVTISFANINALIGLLAPSTSNDTALLSNLYSSQFLPNPVVANDTVVQRYRAAATRIGVSASSYSGLEGYLMGRLAIAALQSIKGFNFTPQAFMDSIYRESFFGFEDSNIGPFYPSTIHNGCNQGIHGVPTQSVEDADVRTVVFVYRESSDALCWLSLRVVGCVQRGKQRGRYICYVIKTSLKVSVLYEATAYGKDLRD